jgi:hypothetical protein
MLLVQSSLIFPYFFCVGYYRNIGTSVGSADLCWHDACLPSCILGWLHAFPGCPFLYILNVHAGAHAYWSAYTLTWRHGWLRAYFSLCMLECRHTLSACMLMCFHIRLHAWTQTCLPYACLDAGTLYCVLKYMPTNLNAWLSACILTFTHASVYKWLFACMLPEGILCTWWLGFQHGNEHKSKQRFPNAVVFCNGDQLIIYNF